MPQWQIDLWAVGLLVSGALGLFGCSYLRDLEFGLIAEAAGMLIGAGALLIAAVSSFEFAGWHALLGGGITVAWTAANLWRAWQIRHDLKELQT